MCVCVCVCVCACVCVCVHVCVYVCACVLCPVSCVLCPVSVSDYLELTPSSPPSCSPHSTAVIGLRLLYLMFSYTCTRYTKQLTSFVMAFEEGDREFFEESPAIAAVERASLC